jgi:excisionase family DNA binding protein
MGQPSDRDLLTEPEAAEALRISLVTLRRWRKAGTAPPAIRVGRAWRYRRGALDRWLAERETTQGEGEG